MVYIGTNPLSGSGLQSLSTGSQAVAKLNQCNRLGTDRNHGISAVRRRFGRRPECADSVEKLGN